MNKVNVQDKINNTGKTKLEKLVGGFVCFFVCFFAHEYNSRMISILDPFFKYQIASCLVTDMSSKILLAAAAVIGTAVYILVWTQLPCYNSRRGRGVTIVTMTCLFRSV